MSSVIYYPGYSQVQVSYFAKYQEITAVTLGLTTTITFSQNDLVAGQGVVFRIPPIFGCQQLNDVLGYITFADGTSIIVDVDSRFFDAFAIPLVLPEAYTPPYCIPNNDMQPIPKPIPDPNQNTIVGATRNEGAL